MNSIHVGVPLNGSTERRVPFPACHRRSDSTTLPPPTESEFFTSNFSVMGCGLRTTFQKDKTAHTVSFWRTSVSLCVECLALECLRCDKS